MKQSPLNQFAQNHKQLFRDSSVENISEDFVVDRVAQYGELQDIKNLISIIGQTKFVSIFKKHLSGKTIHYAPSLINYFNHLFGLYDSTSLGDIISRAKANKRFYR